MTHALPMTSEGRQRLQAELDDLFRQREDLLRQYAADRQSESDEIVLSHLHADLSLLDARITQLSDALDQPDLDAPPTAAPGTIAPGSRVVVRWEDGEESHYQIVAPVEADAVQNRISAVSPVGQALLGRRAGEWVQVETPASETRLYVVTVDGDGALAAHV